MYAKISRREDQKNMLFCYLVRTYFFCRIDDEHIKRMQKEFEQKRKELLLEAENVVRMREEAYNQELLKLQTELEKQRRLQKETIEKMAVAKTNNSNVTTVANAAAANGFEVNNTETSPNTKVSKGCVVQ